MSPDPALFDWPTFLHSSAMLGVQAAVWTFCARAVAYAVAWVGRS